MPQSKHGSSAGVLQPAGVTLLLKEKGKRGKKGEKGGKGERGKKGETGKAVRKD